VGQAQAMRLGGHRPCSPPSWRRPEPALPSLEAQRVHRPPGTPLDLLHGREVDQRSPLPGVIGENVACGAVGIGLAPGLPVPPSLRLSHRH